MCLTLIYANVSGTPALDDLLRTWSWPLFPLASLLIGLLLYLRGWRLARTTRERELPAWRASCFVAGLIALWIALASPIDALDDYLLVAHMIQHFILMSIAAAIDCAGSTGGAAIAGIAAGLHSPLVAAVVSRGMD